MQQNDEIDQVESKQILHIHWQNLMANQGSVNRGLNSTHCQTIQIFPKPKHRLHDLVITQHFNNKQLTKKRNSGRKMRMPKGPAYLSCNFGRPGKSSVIFAPLLVTTIVTTGLFYSFGKHVVNLFILFLKCTLKFILWFMLNCLQAYEWRNWTK